MAGWFIAEIICSKTHAELILELRQRPLLYEQNQHDNNLYLFAQYVPICEPLSRLFRMDCRFHLGRQLRSDLFHAVFLAGVLDALFQDFPFRLAASFKITIHANVSALHNHSHNHFSLLIPAVQFSRAIPNSMSGAAGALPERGEWEEVFRKKRDSTQQHRTLCFRIVDGAEVL